METLLWSPMTNEISDVGERWLGHHVLPYYVIVREEGDIILERRVGDAGIDSYRYDM